VYRGSFKIDSVQTAQKRTGRVERLPVKLILFDGPLREWLIGEAPIGIRLVGWLLIISHYWTAPFRIKLGLDGCL
jgi:hypothetical protein